MDKVKVAYVWAHVFGQTIGWAMAITVPVFVTPGSYWWTLALITLCALDSYTFSKRMDLWTGEIK